MRPRESQTNPAPAAHTRAVVVHQTIGGADLHFRLGIVRAADQRIDGVFAAERDQLLDRFDACIDGRAVQILRDCRNRRRALFRNGTNIFRSLSRKGRMTEEKAEAGAGI